MGITRSEYRKCEREKKKRKNSRYRLGEFLFGNGPLSEEVSGRGLEDR